MSIEEETPSEETTRVEIMIAFADGFSGLFICSLLLLCAAIAAAIIPHAGSALVVAAAFGFIGAAFALLMYQRCKRMVARCEEWS